MSSDNRPHRVNPGWREGKCRLCDSAFIKTGHASKYCSDECRRRASSEQRKKAIRDWRERNPDAVREFGRRGHLKKRFGLTLEEYEKMEREQGGVCAICQREPNGKHRILAVDHCHRTGKIRQLLCMTCNTGLGAFKDNERLLKNAITYLAYHRE